MNIHIGCEFKIGNNWKNYDISITAQIEKIPLLRKFIRINPLPYPKEVIYGDISKKPLCKNNDCDTFIKSIGFGKNKNDKTFKDFLRKIFGNSGHLWMYDNNSMQKYLTETGFKSIRTATIGDSGIKVFSEVEEMHRFIDGDFIEVALQCTK